MNKIKFDNSRATFSTSIPVLVNHLNYGNHLGYDSVLAIIQEARIRWLKKYNLGEKKLSNDTGYLIGDVILNYKSEAFHGDILAVSLYIENIKNKSFEIIYDIRNKPVNNSV